MKSLSLAVALACCLETAHAQPPELKPGLAGVAFLVGNWSTGTGVVADTGGTSTGSSHIQPVVDGTVLLRQDRTALFDKAAKPSGSFEQIMMIYPEGGTLHADYADGTHTIHYVKAEIVQGKSVAFSSAATPGAPVFRLSYRLVAPGSLGVSFGMTPPRGAAFIPIASGTLHTGG